MIWERKKAISWLSYLDLTHFLSGRRTFIFSELLIIHHNLLGEILAQLPTCSLGMMAQFFYLDQKPCLGTELLFLKDKCRFSQFFFECFLTTTLSFRNGYFLFLEYLKILRRYLKGLSQRRALDREFFSLTI